MMYPYGPPLSALDWFSVRAVLFLLTWLRFLRIRSKAQHERVSHVLRLTAAEFTIAGLDCDPADRAALRTYCEQLRTKELQWASSQTAAPASAPAVKRRSRPRRLSPDTQKNRKAYAIYCAQLEKGATVEQAEAEVRSFCQRWLAKRRRKSKHHLLGQEQRLPVRGTRARFGEFVKKTLVSVRARIARAAQKEAAKLYRSYRYGQTPGKRRRLMDEECWRAVFANSLWQTNRVFQTVDIRTDKFRTKAREYVAKLNAADESGAHISLPRKQLKRRKI